MPIQASMEAAQIPWRPLGELLVEHGVLSRDELERALAEQQSSGRKLGEIIVEQGYASSPAVTRALAEQWGLELSPEVGFGSGLWGEIERRHREKRERDSETSQRPPLEHRIIEFPGGQLRALVPAGEESGSEHDELHARALEAEARAEDYAGRADELERVLADTREELARLRTRLAERDRELEELRAAPPRDEAAPASDGAEPAAEPVPSEHVLFFPEAEGYVLAERDGAPPAPGDVVALDQGRELVVLKVARGPMPGDRRPCAYLEPVPRPDEP